MPTSEAVTMATQTLKQHANSVVYFRVTFLFDGTIHRTSRLHCRTTKSGTTDLFVRRLESTRTLNKKPSYRRQPTTSALSKNSETSICD